MCRAVLCGSSPHQLTVYAAHPFKVIQIKCLQVSPELLPPLGTRLDELLVKETFGEDIVSEHVQYSNVGARVDLQMVFCQPGEFDLQGVNNDKWYP